MPDPSHTAAPGTVYLVGAGPGDPGLLTLRGREVLYACDAVVYDRLAASVLPPDLRPEVELHFVGKRADHHSLGQDRISALLVELALAGKDVCRLKGGDPFVFGRGGEEAERLRAEGIPYEVVPGVTAGIAVPAYAGIPVTHRGLAVRFTLVTAHEDPTKASSQVDWRCFGADPNGTVAAYMPVSNLANIAQEMIAGGLDPETPAAVIERGTLPGERIVQAPIRELAARAAAAGIRPPALFVVGRTVGLREKLAWREERPLCGKRVVVTRPADQARKTILGLRALGVDPVLCPSITTVPADAAELAPFLDRIGGYDWVFFTSENGVRYFFAMLATHGLDVRALGGARIAAVGSGTAERLAEYHLRADFLPTAFRGEVMLAEFTAAHPATGLRILRLRGDRGPTTLEDGLRAAGATVDCLLGYHIRPAALRPDVADVLANDGVDAVTFTSGSSVLEFDVMLPDHALHASVPAVCIGPVTAQKAAQVGWQRIVTAGVSTVEGLIEAVAATLRDA